MSPPDLNLPGTVGPLTGLASTEFFFAWGRRPPTFFCGPITPQPKAPAKLFGCVSVLTSFVHWSDSPWAKEIMVLVPYPLHGFVQVPPPDLCPVFQGHDLESSLSGFFNDFFPLQMIVTTGLSTL